MSFQVVTFTTFSGRLNIDTIFDIVGKFTGYPITHIVQDQDRVWGLKSEDKKEHAKNGSYIEDGTIVSYIQGQRIVRVDRQKAGLDLILEDGDKVFCEHPGACADSK